jgi:hypothetical protein
MSAYVVDPSHIDVMLTVAINGPKETRPGGWTPPYVYELLDGDEHTGPVTRETADLAGQALLAENIASVSHRYPDDPPGELPGPIPNPMLAQYEWTDFGKLLTPVEALCAIDGYEYQSCEHPGWWDSGASHFCHRFRSALIGCLPGYEEAEWHWTAEKTLARAPRGGGWRALG